MKATFSFSAADFTTGKYFSITAVAGKTIKLIAVAIASSSAGSALSTTTKNVNAAIAADQADLSTLAGVSLLSFTSGADVRYQQRYLNSATNILAFDSDGNPTSPVGLPMWVGIPPGASIIEGYMDLTFIYDLV